MPSATLAALKSGVDEKRRCPHCGSDGAAARGSSGGAVSRRKARGLRFHRWQACGWTFGALTGTALSGLHHKER